MEVKDKKFTIIGAAKSGISAAKVLLSIGANVFISEILPKEKLLNNLAIAELLNHPKLRFEYNGHTEQALDADYIILSPGVPPSIPILQKAKAKNIPILSEIELAYRLTKGKILVVTGSNGKTTTTTLLAKFCESAFEKVYLGGNIGIPWIEFATKTTPSDIQVLEVSSFQLETISTFKPDIAVITNFYQNHLDRYESYEAYIQTKARVFMNMKENDWLILNANQPKMLEICNQAKCKVAWFGWNLSNNTNTKFLPCTTYIDDQIVYIDNYKKIYKLCHKSEIKLIGKHNYENIMASAIASIIAGVPYSNIAKVITNFTGVEHRLEFVREINGVKYINDSKATNCAASIIAMEACNPPIILIAGGRDKGTELDQWIETIKKKAKGVVLYGEATNRFRAALEGIVEINIANSFEDAVLLAHKWASPGDTVLLSPACSSYDLFENFEQRGNAFKEIVKKL